MTVCAVKKLKGHTGRTFLGILHTASGAEAAFAAEGNKFHVVASGADIHGTAKRRIATIQHFIDIFHRRISGMKSVFDYFIIVIKDFLQDIHNVIMREREEKRKPHPSRLRGRGVEVSKTLFYSADTIIYVLSGKQGYTITNKNYRKAHLPLAVMSTGVSYLLIKEAKNSSMAFRDAPRIGPSSPRVESRISWLCVIGRTVAFMISGRR